MLDSVNIDCLYSYESSYFFFVLIKFTSLVGSIYIITHFINMSWCLLLLTSHCLNNFENSYCGWFKIWDSPQDKFLNKINGTINDNGKRDKGFLFDR